MTCFISDGHENVYWLDWTTCFTMNLHIVLLYLCVCGLNWWWLKSCTRSMMCKIAWSTKCQQYFPLDIQMISCFLFMSYFLKWSFWHENLGRQKNKFVQWIQGDEYDFSIDVWKSFIASILFYHTVFELKPIIISN